MGRNPGCVRSAGHPSARLKASASWILYELARNPEVDERLQSERTDVLGDRPPPSTTCPVCPT
ncbi:cytochrome P450 [Streptomyces sp. NPDC051954]|uniref:cytochrome P450 n=1 Tax=unclassified Streptomyces TaxID=2593676 RepID=UPI0034325DF7